MSNSNILENEKKNSHIFKYIVCFLVFFVLGIAIGIVSTKKYLESKDVEETKPVEEEKIKFEDITENTEYKEEIDNLYKLLAKNPAFYSTKGLNVNNISNEEKLSLVYNYIIYNKLDSTSVLNPGWYGSLTCPFNNGTVNFNLDATLEPSGAVVNGTNCSVSDISSLVISQNYQKIFGDNNIVVSNFNPKETKSCILVGETYTCGNVGNSASIFGDLEVNYEIIKVLKYDDKIEIYDKGYLLDNRSNIKNPNDGHDRYYLHSSDSTEYYYELKSADNIVFKHTFNKAKDGKFYYVSSEVSK